MFLSPLPSVCLCAQTFAWYLQSLHLTLLIRRWSAIQDAPCLLYINNVTLRHHSASVECRTIYWAFIHLPTVTSAASAMSNTFIWFQCPLRLVGSLLFIFMSGELFYMRLEMKINCFSESRGRIHIFFFSWFIWINSHSLFLCSWATGLYVFCLL